jgi:VanZ family protein
MNGEAERRFPPAWCRHMIIPAVALTIAWVFASHMPKPERLGIHIETDWISHGGGYLVMATCWGTWALARRRWSAIKTLALVVAAMAAFGAADELTQPLFSRVCQFRDWLADVTGTLLAVTLLAMVIRARGRSADQAKRIS